MKIRDCVQKAAEEILSQLLVENPARELAFQIGERAEVAILAELSGATEEPKATKPEAKSKAKVGKAKIAEAKAEKTTTQQKSKPQARLSAVRESEEATPADESSAVNGKTQSGLGLL